MPQYQRGHDEGTVLFANEERDRLKKLYAELTKKGAKGWLIVTCRPDDTGLGKIAEMPLGGLTKPDALDMAREILKLRDVVIGEPGYEREVVEALLDAVDRHPLSIELVMAHCKEVTAAEAAKDLRKVIAAASQGAGEERNKNLLASLRWSTGRLSQEAQKVLPYLAWFDGGAFEVLIEDFCHVGPEVWGRVRGELLATALVRVEDGVTIGDKPYLGFHPTLPYAVDPGDVADKADAGKRLVQIYYALAAAMNKTLRGAEPAGAMAVMQREEGNLWRATARAFERAEYELGAGLADTIGSYLVSAGRVREQARLASWVQEHMAQATGSAKWAMEREHAWGLFVEGKGKQAVDRLARQLGEIEQSGGNTRQRALCLGYLGRILESAGQPQHALGPLAEAIQGFEAAGDRVNLAAALGNQADALRALGRLPKALDAAERAAAIVRELGDARNEAVALVVTAQILRDQHRFGEAEQRYEQALAAARRAGDGGLEGVALQHLGFVTHSLGRPALAVARYQEALERFRAVDDKAGEMKTADLLGTVEKDLGHFEAAWAWHTESERLAQELGDEKHLGTVAQNLGILLQTQALALPAEAAEERRRLLGEAVASVSTSLALKQKRGDEVDAAASLHQLGVLHIYLGDLDEAERHAQQALAFFGPRDLPAVAKVYIVLANIAAARGRPDEAAAWRAKMEAKRAHLQRLAKRGP